MTTTRRRSGSKGENHETRFLNKGIDFKAKVVGDAVVPAARGEKMCHDILRSLKAKVKTSGKHKPRVVINVAVDGIKVKDEKSQEVLKTFHIHTISFISHDPADSRVFALIDGVQEDQGYTLHAFKSEKTASAVTNAIKQLFQLVYKYRREMKRKEAEKKVENKPAANGAASATVADSKHLDTTTGEDMFADLASVRSQMQSTDPPEDWYQVPKQIMEQHATEDLYQVPSNIPATQPTKPNNLSQAAVIQEWSHLSADLDQIAKELSVVDGPSMFPPSDVFGSDPFATSTNNDSLTSPTRSLSEKDPFSPLKKEPLSTQTDLHTNNFPLSDPFGSTQDTSKQSFDPFGMESTSVPSGLFKNDPFSQHNESGISTSHPTATSAASGAFGDSFSELFVPPAQQETTSLSPHTLSPVSADPFGMQTVSLEHKQLNQQKDPFRATGLPASDSSQQNNVDAFGSFTFGNSQKQEVSTDDRFAALRLLDDDTTSTSIFPAASAGPDTSQPMVSFRDPFSVIGSSASTQSQGHQISAFNNATISIADSTVSDPFAALNNVPSVPTAEQQKPRDPFALIPTSFPLGVNSSDPFVSGGSAGGDMSGSQPPSQSLVGFNQLQVVSPSENAESSFVSTAFAALKDPFTDSQPSVSASLTSANDPFTCLFRGATSGTPNTTAHMASASVQGLAQIQPQPKSANSVDPFGSSLGGDLFSTVPSSSPQVTFIQGPGGLGNDTDPFSSLRGFPQPQISNVSQSTAADPFSALNAPKHQMSPTLRGSKSAGSIGIITTPSSTNPFLASNVTVPTSHTLNPFADHPSVRSTVQQEQQRQTTANPFVDFTNQGLFGST